MERDREMHSAPKPWLRDMQNLISETDLWRTTLPFSIPQVQSNIAVT